MYSRAIILLLLAIEVIQSCHVTPAGPEVETTGEYMIVLKDNITHSRYEAIVAEAFKESLNSKISKKIESPFVKLITAKLSKSGAHKLCLLDGVEFIEEETYAHGSISWAIDRIDQTDPVLDGYSNSNGDGQGVNIYLLDSGINYDHCEFGERAKYAGYDPVDNMKGTHQNGKDCSGHGTHIASVTVGATLGVATKANIKSVRVLDCNNTSPWSIVIDGLNYAAENITQADHIPDIILMPLEGAYSEAINKILHNIISHNIPVIAAAGNNGNDACQTSPGGTDEVITVGGSTIGDDIFSDTNCGLCVDIFAPATMVMGGTHNCNTCSCKSTLSGTSIAAGLVTGVVALYLQKEPTLAPIKIKNKLTQTCIHGSLNFSALPVNLKPLTPNCLLYINASKVTVTKTITIPTPTATPVSESVCCSALRNIDNLKASVTDSVGSIVEENINQLRSIIQANITYLLTNGGIKIPSVNTTSTGTSAAGKKSYKPGDTLDSCENAVQYSLKSGYFWVKTSNEDSYVYCELEKEIKGNKGFLRVANINMSVPGTECPVGLSLRQDGTLKTCQRGQNEPGCSSTFFKTNGVQYTKVCGRVRGYQWSSPNAFYSYTKNAYLTIDKPYVDGVILSHRNGFNRKHIWTFAAATDEISRSTPFACPCTNIAANQVQNHIIPSFVGRDYFCETGTRDTYVSGKFYTDDPLWDGAGCGEMDTCCQKGQWFCKDVPTSSSDIELRLCGNEARSNEDTPLEIIELYVK